jgi:DNA polymerase-1
LAKNKTIILIDGSNLLYRAFFALPVTMATRFGQVTNAAYGFTSMLLKLLREEKPAGMAVAFDRPAATFRHEAYEEYKAHRVAIPSELPSQIPLSKEILHVLKIPVFELEGYEADDILSFLATRAEKEGYDVLVVTGDKDALQLVSPHVKIMTTRKGITDTFIYDRQRVQEKYGITPERIPDMLGLKGDPSDNIPGVPGIGEKTASKLIQEFGSLEEVYKNIDKVTGRKIHDALVEYEDQARLSKELAILKRDVPLEINLEDTKIMPVDRDEVRKLFSALEFRTLMQRLEEEEILPEATAGEAVAPKIVPTNSDNVTSLKKHLAENKETALEVSVDGLAIAFKDDTVYYLSDGLDTLKFYLEDGDIPKIVYDAKEKFRELKKENINLAGIVFDPMLGAYLLDPGRRDYPLEDLVIEYLGKGFAAENGEKVLCRRALASLRLRELVEKDLRERGLWKLFEKVELPLSGVLARMELTGVGVDVSRLEDLADEIGSYLYRVEEEIYELAGQEFNINSPQQLGVILFEKLGLKPEKKTKTGYATGFSVLVKHLNEHPIIEKILVYRELAKLKSGYIDALPKLVDSETGRLHTYLNQVGTATGRLASSEPNLQNIPIRGEWGARIREAFVPSHPTKEELLVADYSQIELRILAHLSEDEELIASFKAGEDIHAATAREILGVKTVTSDMRRLAKAVNFGLIYGISSFGLASQVGISEEGAQEYIEKYFQRYPAVRSFIDRIIGEAYKNGYVTTILGRIRYIPELSSSNYSVKRLGERLAINTTIQGSAADIIKIAMINLDREIEKRALKTKMVLQVHDELIFEVPLSEKEIVSFLVREEMEKAYSLKADLRVNLSFGRNWGETKE